MKTISIVLFLIALMFHVAAGDVKAADSDFDIRIYFEDDYPKMCVGGADRAYTAGERISLVSAFAKLPNWAAPFVGWLDSDDAKYNFGLSIGQQIYTPEDLSQSAPVNDDEPYAGYLFYGASLQVRKGAVLHRFEIDLGITGPPSLGDQTQITFHRAFGFQPVQGWGNQIHTEPTIAIFYQQQRRLGELRIGDTRILDLTPRLTAVMGNVFVYGGAGAQLRLGYSLRDDFGPTVLTPVGSDAYREPTDSDHPETFFEVYAFAASEIRWMVRNLFLDGNSFSDSPRIDKVPWVYDFDFGAALRFGRVQLLWQEVVRSREFRGERKAHPFASVVLTYHQPL